MKFKEWWIFCHENNSCWMVRNCIRFHSPQRAKTFPSLIFFFSLLNLFCDLQILSMSSRSIQFYPFQCSYRIKVAWKMFISISPFPFLLNQITQSCLDVLRDKLQYQWMPLLSFQCFPHIATNVFWFKYNNHFLSRRCCVCWWLRRWRWRETMTLVVVVDFIPPLHCHFVLSSFLFTCLTCLLKWFTASPLSSSSPCLQVHSSW